MIRNGQRSACLFILATCFICFVRAGDAPTRLEIVPERDLAPFSDWYGMYGPDGKKIGHANMVLEKSKRLVECGLDVIIFLDSITRLARAWNSECPQSGKLLTGGLDANALQQPKRFFGSARKVEEGGSLTILATALVDTGSKMDDVIFEEFKGTGNLEILLDRKLVDRRIWPAIDINKSGTRREEILMEPDEYRRVTVMRRVLADMNSPDAMELLVTRLAKTKTNAEFLMSMNIKQ